MRLGTFKLLHVLAVVFIRILWNVVWIWAIQVYTGTAWQFWCTSRTWKTFVLYFGKGELLISKNQLLIASQTLLFAIFLVKHLWLAIFATCYFSIGTRFKYLSFSTSECCAIVVVLAIPFLQFFRKCLPFLLFL